MEPINDDVLSHAAHLARIRIDPEQDHRIIDEIKAFFTWLRAIETIETGHIETKDIFPLSPSTPDERRSDHPNKPVKREDLLAHAPATTAGYFIVPR